MNKPVVFKTVCIGIVASAAASCGSGGSGASGGAALNDAESRYSATCASTLEKMGQSGKQSLCDCTARIIVPKLSEGELNSFTNMGPELLGKPLTDEMTRPHGFTTADNQNYFRKFAEAKPEIDRQCGT